MVDSAVRGAHQPKHQQWRWRERSTPSFCRKSKNNAQPGRREEKEKQARDHVFSVCAVLCEWRFGLIKVLLFARIAIKPAWEWSIKTSVIILIMCKLCTTQTLVHYLRDQMTGRPSAPVLMETLAPPGTSPTERKKQFMRERIARRCE